MSSIAGIITGVFVTITGATDGTFSAQDALNLDRVIYAVDQKTESGTWGASAHEESHQIIKDTIRGLNK